MKQRKSFYLAESYNSPQMDVLLTHIDTEDVNNFAVYLVQTLATSPDLPFHAGMTGGQQPSGLFVSWVQVSL
jgi:hypothetical protein